MAAEDGHTERVKVVYVVSRMIEFIELGGEDTLAHRLRQLHVLIQRDKVQSDYNYAQAAALEQLTAVPKPAEHCWQKAAGRRARPAVTHQTPVANRFAALAGDQGLCDEGNTGSTEGSDGSSTTTRVLNGLRRAAEVGQRRMRRRPAPSTSTQDLEYHNTVSHAWEYSGTTKSVTEEPQAAVKGTQLVQVDLLTNQSYMQKHHDSSGSADNLNMKDVPLERLAPNQHSETSAWDSAADGPAPGQGDGVGQQECSLIRRSTAATLEAMVLQAKQWLEHYTKLGDAQSMKDMAELIVQLESDGQEDTNDSRFLSVDV